MRRLLPVFLGILLTHSAFADDTAHLKVNITGPINANTYFLCVPNTGGCVSIYASSKGKKFPMNAGKVETIFMANASNLRMYTQELPSSCDVNIDNNQTLTVSGHIVVKSKGDKNSAYISELRCKVA